MSSAQDTTAPRLDHAAITALHAAAQRCRLDSPSWRAPLFDGINALMGRVTRPHEDRGALLADLIWLNDNPVVAGVHGPPLAMWLLNAARLMGDRPEAAVFRAQRAALLTRPDGTRAPEPFGPRPWPLLQPYTDPRLFAGRDAEIAGLVDHVLTGPHLFTGLHAPSGFGKSSLLAAGLLPTLRAQGVGAARVTEPHRPLVGARLLRQLGLPIDPLPADEAPDGWLAACAGMAHPPVLVLDQFEELFKTTDPEPQRRVALLLAAVARWTSAHGAPPARVVLSYREEYHGRVQRWLAAEIGAALGAEREDYPTALAGTRFAGFRLPPLRAAGFAAAITRPLTVHPGGFRFEGDGAERLAKAFAAVREADPGAPLVPELQVVLGELIDASPAGALRVPSDAGGMIAEALAKHLREHVRAFTTDRLLTTRVWLGLRRLITPAGACAPPLPEAELLGTLPADAVRVLSAPDARVLVAQADPNADAPRWRLSHDALAATVHGMTPAESGIAPALFDAEALIAQRSALYARQPSGTAHLGVPKPARQRIAAHPWLLSTDARAQWWAAVQRHTRRVRLGLVALGVFVALAAALVGWSVQQAREATQRREAYHEIAQARPESAALVLQAVATARALDPDGARLAALIAEEQPYDAALALTTTDLEATREWLIDALMGHAKTARQFGALVAGTELARHPETPGRWTEARYRAARRRLHAALIKRFDKPPTGLDWRTVPAGRFIMGSDEHPHEQPMHPVTISKPYLMLRYEVRRGDVAGFEPPRDGLAPWQRAVLDAIQGGGVDLTTLPAWGYDWFEANALAAWLHPLGRLPTEAEWEYAARGGSAPPEAWRNAAVDDVAWHKDNSNEHTRGQREPHAVCALEERRPLHPFGLCDLRGNLWEWVADRLTLGQGYPSAEATTDPIELRRGAVRGRRGGSFLIDSAHARPANRFGR